MDECAAVSTSTGHLCYHFTVSTAGFSQGGHSAPSPKKQGAKLVDLRDPG